MVVGFRLPMALDNRPLKFEEWDSRRGQTVFVSATPADWELDQSEGEIVQQVIRPTGLVDPVDVPEQLGLFPLLSCLLIIDHRGDAQTERLS